MVAVLRCSTMLRKTIYATPILILTMGAALAQEDKPGLPGYNNVLRDNLERNRDKDIDRAYQSTRKVIPDTKKEKSDPWGDVRPEPPTAAKNKRQ